MSVLGEMETICIESIFSSMWEWGLSNVFRGKLYSIPLLVALGWTLNEQSLPYYICKQREAGRCLTARLNYGTKQASTKRRRPVGNRVMKCRRPFLALAGQSPRHATCLRVLACSCVRALQICGGCSSCAVTLLRRCIVPP